LITLDNLIVHDLVKQALKEDIGHGDLTTNAFISPEKNAKAVFNSRESCIISGLQVAETVYKILDPYIEFKPLIQDGDKISPGENIAVVKGNARAIITGERVALNFLQRMSGIASKTYKYQQAINPYKAKIADTRKSCPNFRIFEKYSVKVGGGSPHRFGLFDCVMIKDNHIEIAGSIEDAVKTARNNIPHTIKIEVETENLAQVEEALNAGADIIMLDNMPISDMKKAVDYIKGRAIVEASGKISIESINSIAATGVDIISTSTITAKAGIIDIGLDV